MRVFSFIIISLLIFTFWSTRRLFSQEPPKHFTFRPLQEQDLPQLLQWFKEPHVAQWWPIPKQDEEFFTKFLQRIRSKDTFPYLILLDNKPFGYIQYYLIDRAKSSWMPALPEHIVGTDQFIGDPYYLGKGYGPLFLKAFIELLTQQHPVLQAVIVDPDPANKAALRCYEKAGFKVLGEYKAPLGPALLMQYTITLNH